MDDDEAIPVLAFEEGQVDLQADTVPVGSRLTSFLIHFDPVSADVDLTAGGANPVVLTFDAPIKGIVVDPIALDESDDELGIQPLSAYPQAVAKRGLELLSQEDAAVISTDRKTLTLTLEVKLQLDQLRVLTEWAGAESYLYVSSNNRDGGLAGDQGGAIQRIDVDGNWEDFTNLPPQLTEPVGFDFDGMGVFGGDIWIANSSDPPADVFRVDGNGQASVFFEQGFLVYDVTFGPGGGYGTDLYFTDWFSDQIYTVDGAANATPFAALSPGVDPGWLVWARGGAFGTALYVVEDGPSIHKLAADGTSELFATGFAPSTGAIPHIAFSPDGTAMYYMGRDERRILRIERGGPLFAPAPSAGPGLRPGGERLSNANPTDAKEPARTTTFQHGLVLDTGGLAPGVAYVFAARDLASVSSGASVRDRPDARLVEVLRYAGDRQPIAIEGFGGSLLVGAILVSASDCTVTNTLRLTSR